MMISKIEEQISTIVLVLIMVQIAMPIHFVNAKQVCEKTTLYTLTSHPQAIHTILCHPVGKELAAANNANIQYNLGIIAAQKTNTIKCPVGHTKSYCDGWPIYQKIFEIKDGPIKFNSNPGYGYNSVDAVLVFIYCKSRSADSIDGDNSCGIWKHYL